MAMTKNANVNVRIQENIKVRAEEILETLGIPRATAIDMFYRQIILHQGMPFELTVPKKLPSLEDLSEGGFQVLMSEGYSQALAGNTFDADEVFDDLEKDLRRDQAQQLENLDSEKENH